MVPAACRTGGVLCHPFLDVPQTAPVSTALAPHVEAPHHRVADGAPGGRGLTLLAPPGTAGLVHALPAPRAAGVDRGGLLVLGVD